MYVRTESNYVISRNKININKRLKFAQIVFLYQTF